MADATTTVQGDSAASAGNQQLATVIAAAVTAAVETKIEQLTGTWNDRLSSLENSIKRGSIDDDAFVDSIDVGTGDPHERAARMSNSRDRNDFYRDALQGLTVQNGQLMNALTARYLASFAAREADRYAAGSPVPPGAKAI